MAGISFNISFNPKKWGSTFGNSGFEKDGTYVAEGNATYWRDIDFPVIIRTVAANKPTLAVLQGNITAPQWAVNDYYVCDGQELVHEWKEGSTLYWHLHMTTNGSDTEDRYIQWEVEYAWSNVNSQLSANTIITHEFLIPANTPDRTMFLVGVGNFTPAGCRIGGHVYARLRRIASAGTAPTSNPFCTMLQLHAECDTLGSREISSK